MPAVVEEDSKDIITADCIRETHRQTSSRKLLSSKARSRSADRLLDNDEKKGRMPPAKNFFKTLLRKGEQIKYL